MSRDQIMMLYTAFILIIIVVLRVVRYVKKRNASGVPKNINPPAPPPVKWPGIDARINAGYKWWHISKGDKDTIRDLQKQVFEWAQSKGWTERPVSIPEQVALIHSEASEALESWRKAEPMSWTAEGGKPEGIASEYADIVIRVLHYSALNGIDLQSEIARKMSYNQTRPYKHGGKQG